MLEKKDVEISTLKFADYNPRTLSSKQKLELTESLQRFGFVEPIIVNKHAGRENIIIGGHQRVTCWDGLGNKTVPAVFVDLPLEKEKELNIRLNKNTGDWDWEKLEANYDIDGLVDWGFDKYDFPLSDLDKPDYDEVEGEVEEVKEMEENAGKAIQIQFNNDIYDEVVSLLKTANKHNKNVGNICYMALKRELNGL